MVVDVAFKEDRKRPREDRQTGDDVGLRRRHQVWQRWDGLAWDIFRERAMHIALQLDIRPSNGAIHVLQSRSL